MSGMLKIAPSDACLAAFSKMQKSAKKGGADAKKDRWQIYVIDKKEINLETSQEYEADTEHEQVLKDFTDALKSKYEKQCRFGVVDYRGKLFFVYWGPENGGIREKMQYSSIKDSFKGSLAGVHFDLQANDPSDVDQTKFDGKIKAI